MHTSQSARRGAAGAALDIESGLLHDGGGPSGAGSDAGSEAGGACGASPGASCPHGPGPAHAHGSPTSGKPPASWRPLATWPPLRAASPHLRHAAALLDRGCLAGCEVAGARPEVRVGVAGYLLVAHLMLWALLFARHHGCGPAV